GDLYVIRVESDRYGRTVAELFKPTPQGGEINLKTQMIMDCHSWNWTQYSQRCPNAQTYQVAESIARERGLYPPP
ncbi:thermonuclease family protein, partial [Limnospira sp. PMC 289.06]|uniref:thermonuclease family protein n=1 Tax=Limnospira sp. PMC 289.06 TaxID=2981094 RepID=UPI0028E136AA|nr:thermonuclease family protein [Limnospira sp. PMC 289.06]